MQQPPAAAHVDSLPTPQAQGDPSQFGDNLVWLKAVVNASPLPLEVVDRDRRVRVWNRAAETAYGWTESDMVGRVPPFLGHLPEECQQQWEGWFSHILSAGEPLHHQASKRRSRDGLLTDVRISAWPLRDAQGEVIGVLVTESDEGRRVRFLRIAAHELRNPMATIKGIVALFRRRLESGRSTEGITSLLEVVEGEIDRLSTILNEVLEGFQVAAGYLDLNEARIDLADVVHAAMRPFQAAPGAHRFVADGVAESGVWVWGDARRLETVLRNLVANGRKYSPDGGEVRVSVRTMSGSVQVTVQDQGIGIPEDELEKIFDPFYRSPTLAGERDPGGLGLGLYLCADIVRRHHGRIWASNNPTGGAAVHFELPSASEGAAL